MQGCSNKSDPKNGISAHASPIDKQERAKWKRFVSTHRFNFEPENRFTVCSEHFEDKCFERAVHIEGSKRILKPGSVPNIWKPEVSTSVPSQVALSDRSRRQVSLETSLRFSRKFDNTFKLMGRNLRSQLR